MSAREIHRNRVRLTPELLGAMSEADLDELKDLYDRDGAGIAKRLTEEGAQFLSSDQRRKMKRVGHIVTLLSKLVQKELGARGRRQAEGTQGEHQFSAALLKAMDVLLDSGVKAQVVELAKSMVSPADAAN